jgi:NADH-quinone oxidoreductase subunit N
MYFREGQPETAPVTSGFKAVLVAVALLIVLIGIFPTIVLSGFYF